MENNNININLSTEEKKSPIYARMWEEVVSAIANAKWGLIIKVYFVLFFFLATAIALVFAFTAAKDTEFVKSTTERVSQAQHEENIRDFVVTPKIQHELSKLVYSLNADRAFLFELHNGKKNTSGLPFRFADMTYEEINEDKKTDKVAMTFQDVPLTLYKYPHYLQKKKVMIGTVMEVSDIDQDFAKHIKDIGGVYVGIIYINNNGLPLGFLGISYHDKEDVPSKDFIEQKLREYDKIIGQLLDLDVVLRSNKKVN